MDVLKEWPEPIVRVQSLADSGVSVIPDRYIKPPSDRPSEMPPDSGSLNIPVIDLASLSAGDDAARQSVMIQISNACREWGFFQAVNHGVSPDLMKKSRESWREFFHLPLADKQVYANSPKTYEGYGSRLGVQKGAILDWGDYFFLNLLPNTLKDHNKWPDVPSSCRELIEEYSSQVLDLCRRLLKVFSLNLGLKEEYLQNLFGGEDVGANIRTNFYPRCPQPQLTLGLSSHSDPGGLTLLLPDNRVNGLQIRKGGVWITVKSVPDSFIVNIGDQIQIMSNSIYKSVEHRVMVNSLEERLSIAFFYNPKSDIPIGPVKELLKSGQPAMCSPMTFDQYRLLIRSRGPQGKTHVQSLVSEESHPRKPGS